MTSQSWKRIIPSFILSILCAAARRKETIFIFFSWNCTIFPIFSSTRNWIWNVKQLFKSVTQGNKTDDDDEVVNIEMGSEPSFP